MIDWERVQLGSLAQWLSAIGTISAVIIALFKDRITAWRNRPKLSVRSLRSPPDLDEIPYYYPMPGAPVYMPPVYKSADSYFLRLWIQNDGKTRAEKVQVFVENVFRETFPDTFEKMVSFIPMNLRWGFGSEKPTHAEVFADGISPGMGAHCILAHVIDPRKRHEIREYHLYTKKYPNTEHTVLYLETEMQPTNLCAILSPGTYRLKLLIAGSNCKPQPHTIEIRLDGRWFDDREKMLQDGVMMKKID